MHTTASEEYFTVWHTIDSQGGEGLARVVKCATLEQARQTAQRALSVITVEGHKDTSMLEWDAERAVISIRVCVPGPMTAEYRQLAVKIDEALK